MASGEKVACLETKGKFVMSVAYSSDGKTLACGAMDGAINVFDVETATHKAKLEGTKQDWSLFEH